MPKQETRTTTTPSPLAKAPATANLTTTDTARSKAFYKETLGLPIEMEMDEFAFSVGAGDGTSIFVYVRDEAPRATNTVVSFSVRKLDEVVDSLRERGVEFEEYDEPAEIRTTDGIAGDEEHGRMAWFKDPDGNVIGLYEVTEST